MTRKHVVVAPTAARAAPDAGMGVSAVLAAILGATGLAMLVYIAATLMMGSGPAVLMPVPTRRAALWNIASGIGYPALGMVVALLARRRRGEAALGLAFSAIGLNEAINTLSWLVEAPGLAHLGAPSYAFGAAAFIRAAQLFPRPIGPADVDAWTRWTFLRPAAAILRSLLGPARTWAGVGATLVAVQYLRLPLLSGIARLAVLLLGLLYFWVGYRSAGEEGRRRVFWFLQAVIVVVAVACLNLSFHAFTVLAHLTLPLARIGIGLNFISSAAVVTCSLLAVFYVGALDPRPVVRKTMVYGTLASLSVLLLGVIEQVVSSAVARLLELDDTVSSAIGGAALGFLFRPVHDRMDALAGRVLGLPSRERPANSVQHRAG